MKKLILKLIIASLLALGAISIATFNSNSNIAYDCLGDNPGCG